MILGGNQQCIVTNGQNVMMPVYPTGSSFQNTSVVGSYQNQSAFSKPGARAQLTTTLPYYLNSRNVTKYSAGGVQGGTSVTYSECCYVWKDLQPWKKLWLKVKKRKKN